MTKQIETLYCSFCGYRLLRAAVTLQALSLSLFLTQQLAAQGTFTQKSESKREIERDAIASEVRGVLRSRCARCHHYQKVTEDKFDVLDRQSLIDAGYLDDSGGKDAVTASYIWDVVADSSMPKGTPRKLTQTERKLIRDWIMVGAPEPSPANRGFVSNQAILESIRDDLQNRVKKDDRKHQRYFSIANMYNDPSVTDRELVLARIAFAKTVNSLSQGNDPKPPRGILIIPEFHNDEMGDSQSKTPYKPQILIFRVDLREYRWDTNNAWSYILANYPYGGLFLEEKLRDLNAQISGLLGFHQKSEIAYLRADWLISEATRPPLYHEILQIPETAQELENSLGVKRWDKAPNTFYQPEFKFMRAGFSVSGVSTHNRMVERHETIGRGGYWISYDFKASEGLGNLFQFPLGPQFPENDFANPAFDKNSAFLHDGGEIIFSLPNGMQAYMLVSRDGKRLDVPAPIEIVRDPLEISGNPSVINGLSCMNCHATGMIPFADEVRTRHGLLGEAKLLVERQYPPSRAFQVKVKADEDRFMTAYKRSVEPYLEWPDGSPVSIQDIPEPIGRVARYYNTEISLEKAAAELGITEPDLVKAAITHNPSLKRRGLKPLATGGLIKREVWESRSVLVSPAQEVMSILEIATPYIRLK